MELNIAYKHMESTPSIEEKIEKKATKLKKYFHGKINVDWICSVEGDQHHSEVTVSGSRFQAHASATEDNLYKTFDSVIAKLEKQLAKRDEKVKDKLHRKPE